MATQKNVFEIDMGYSDSPPADTTDSRDTKKNVLETDMDYSGPPLEETKPKDPKINTVANQKGYSGTSS